MFAPSFDVPDEVFRYLACVTSCDVTYCCNFDVSGQTRETELEENEPFIIGSTVQCLRGSFLEELYELHKFIVWQGQG